MAKKASRFQACVHGLFLTFMFGFYWYCYTVGGALIYNNRINPATGEVYEISAIISVA